MLALLAQALAPLGRDYAVAHHDTFDQRGIDVAFLYDQTLFTAEAQFSHVVMRRTATRDLLQVNFRTARGRLLVLIGNHWPSRTGGQWESAGYRAIAGETVAYFHQRVLDVHGPETPVLAMGDFNDEPFDVSLGNHALSSRGPTQVIYQAHAKKAYTRSGGSSPVPTRRSTGVRQDEDPTQFRAKAVRAQWVLQADLQRTEGSSAEVSGHTFDELMLAYLGAVTVLKKAPDRDHTSAKQLYPVFSGRLLEDLRVADARTYVARRQATGAAAGTINKEVGLFSAALNWSRRELEWEVLNPFQGRRLREPPGRSRWLTRAEAAALLRATELVKQAPHLADFIRLGLYTGMRSGEILGLEWRRIDLQAGLVYLEADDQKNGKVGSVPLNQEARRAILARMRFRATYCPASPWVFCNRRGQRIASVKKGFATAVATAGLTDVHPHDLRRTCGSWLVQEGVPIQGSRWSAPCCATRTSGSPIGSTRTPPTTVQAAVEVLDRPAKTGTVSRWPKSPKGGGEHDAT